eukprot:GILJ01004555.1.p1 GENE.GILJ01004555.1~~GILJ01004555.1.p1  ORF type:complete len:457 (+),score=51.38 GILJ01004555.1:142-1512(+)
MPNIAAILVSLTFGVVVVLSVTSLTYHFASDKISTLSGLVDENCADIETIDRTNRIIFPLLQDLKKRTFFRIFQVDLNSECPFWAQNVMCESSACGVCECPHDQIPLPWKMQKSDEVDRAVRDSFTSWPLRDDNLLVKNMRWDQMDPNQWIATSTPEKATYVDLALNPEAYTAYRGYASGKIWDAIYKENCFTGDSDPSSSSCVEGRVFYRTISGLHASISSHIAENYNEDGTVLPSLEVYTERLAAFPERRKNIYFALSLMLRALNRGAALVEAYPYDTGNAEDDEAVRQSIQHLTQAVSQQCESPFDETVLFKQESLRQQFQRNFRNISLIMDCVSCEKCRLHGKLQIQGLGTAFRMLFDPIVPSITASKMTEEPVPRVEAVLQRNDVIAFINTLSKFSTALHIQEAMQGRARRLVLLQGLALSFVCLLLIVTAILLWRTLSFKRQRTSKRHIE